MESSEIYLTRKQSMECAKRFKVSPATISYARRFLNRSLLAREARSFMINHLNAHFIINPQQTINAE